MIQFLHLKVKFTFLREIVNEKYFVIKALLRFYSFEHKSTTNRLTFNIASINPSDSRNRNISSVVKKDKDCIGYQYHTTLNKA